MKRLIKLESGWTRTFLAFVLVATGCLVLSTALARQRRATPKAPAIAAAAGRSAIYGQGNFSFAAPQELTGHPASPAFFQADAEPEVITDIFGNIYVTAIQGVPGGTDLWKSTDKGASFSYLGQPDGAQDHCNPPTVQCAAVGGGDDQIDVSTGGYLYVSSLWLGNVTMSASYDGGTGGISPEQKWQVNPAAANLVSDDRQWVAAYGPQTVYMSFATTALTRPPGSIGLFITKSTDGGKTFPSLVEITAATPLDTVNVESNLVVDPYNGNLYAAYIPNAALNVINLASSTDGGATWNITTAYTGPTGTTNRGVFPILALDRGGNLHLAFTNSTPTTPRTNCHVYLTSTANPAAATPTWLPAVQVDSSAVDPDTTTACEAWIVAGSPGVVDIAWLGTSSTSTDQIPGVPTITPTWHVFFAQTTNAMAATPTFSQNKVETAVMHNHSICMNGLGCTAASTPHGEPGNRDLLEYFRMALDPDGNANIVYADSVNNCPATTCRTNTWFAKQAAGSTAYAPPAPPAATIFGSNINVNAAGGGGAEPNAKVDSYNCLYSAAPGNPDFWKSINNGLSFLAPVNPVANETGLTGGDEDIISFPQASGARPDQLYFADLGIATVHIRKSTNGGATWFAPGTNGAAGEVSASVDRQWMAADRNGADQTLYLMEHEFASQAIRFHALTDDTAWSAPASGITTPELIAPPGSTLSNTNPGPVFIDRNSHMVYGVFNASTVTSNAIGAPTGKLPNIWEAAGAGTFTSPTPPGPFTNYPVFRGVFDSPTNPAPPAGAQTFGANTGNLFCGGTIDSSGNIYVAWATPSARNNQYQIWFASSHDHGQNFYGPFLISSAAGQATTPWIAAGDNGRVAIVYYATPDTESPNTSTHDRWHVMFAQSLNAADREPVFSVTEAGDHVNHTGPICNVGILCASGTRNLLDFFQVAIGPDGLANVVYADDSSGGVHPVLARQVSGPLALVNPTTPTCLAAPSIVPLSAISRKTHGSSGTYDIDLPLTGSPGIECRTGGSNGDHTVVVSFANPVTVGSASVASSDGLATADAPVVNNQLVTINLHHVSNQQTLVISLTNVSNGTQTGNVSVPMGVLLGDTTGNRAVNSSDVGQTQQQSGQPVSISNFRTDVTANGAINSSDISVVQAQSGTGLP